MSRVVEGLVPPWQHERRTLMRVEAKTDTRYGYNPYERPIRMHLRLGVINLDKPRGPTSHEVSSKIKGLLGIKRAGHGGTLEGFKPGDIQPFLACYLYCWKNLPNAPKQSCKLEKSMSV